MNERHSFDLPKAGRCQSFDRLDLQVGGQELVLHLKSVTRPDLDHLGPCDCFVRTHWLLHDCFPAGRPTSETSASGRAGSSMGSDSDHIVASQTFELIGAQAQEFAVDLVVVSAKLGPGPFGASRRFGQTRKDRGDLEWLSPWNSTSSNSSRAWY